MAKNEFKTTVKVDRLFLATDNPRHEEVDDELEAIESLCKHENVEELARDILLHGPSPAERLIVYPSDETVGIEAINDKTTFIVAEGNRRLCALKLLHDPELAPVQVRDTISRLVDGKVVVDEVDVVVILDPERRNHWLRRIHDGVQGGKGRKPWNAEQRTRFSGSRRNIIAQQLFDFAVRRGLMDQAERRGNFSHMARLVGNVLVSETLGLDLSQGVEELLRNRPLDEFETILKVILEEAKTKSLGSQASKADIDRFARNLNTLDGVTVSRIHPEPMDPGDEDANQEKNEEDNGASEGGSTEDENAGGGNSSTNKKTRVKKYIVREKEIQEGLEAINHDKLLSLYASITSINCETHTPLLAVGVWSFVETISAAMGSDKPFKDYFTRGKNGKLSELGLGHGQQINSIVEALARIAGYGNTTKHDGVAAYYDYRQVINDMKTLTPLVVACIKDLNPNG